MATNSRCWEDWQTSRHFRCGVCVVCMFVCLAVGGGAADWPPHPRCWEDWQTSCPFRCGVCGVCMFVCLAVGRGAADWPPKPMVLGRLLADFPSFQVSLALGLRLAFVCVRVHVASLCGFVFVWTAPAMLVCLGCRVFGGRIGLVGGSGASRFLRHRVLTDPFDLAAIRGRLPLPLHPPCGRLGWPKTCGRRTPHGFCKEGRHAVR